MRAWWNVMHYDIHVEPDFETRSILGRTVITFQTTESGSTMQIDLQQPLVIDSMYLEQHMGTSTHQQGVKQPALHYNRKEATVEVSFDQKLTHDQLYNLTIYYHGTPKEAKNPPWDGGWIWKTDKNGAPWMSLACQGLGASVWYPCKDHQSDEPDQGASLSITVPDTLMGIGNGRLSAIENDSNGTKTYCWKVTSPINNYNIVPYIGKYAHIADSIQGGNGKLNLDYWVLEDNVQKAKKHFEQVKPMMECFEDQFGPYPFYTDGYKLVESPHLGMEHQSAVAYGNAYKMGYRGRDLSGSGIGLQFDFIIIHESGHEWFGNSITTADIADLWIHESFTAYSETIYAECLLGKEKAGQYVRGTRQAILNDKPIIGPYGVNKEGSQDMYYKGANMLHMIRFYMGDDAFKSVLRDLNIIYRHSITTSREVEELFDQRCTMDLQVIFDQYLRHRDTPQLEYKRQDKRLHMRLTKCLEAFSLPIHFTLNGEPHTQELGREWLIVDKKINKKFDFEVEPDLLLKVKKVATGKL